MSNPLQNHDYSKLHAAGYRNTARACFCFCFGFGLIVATMDIPVAVAAAPFRLLLLLLLLLQAACVTTSPVAAAIIFVRDDKCAAPGLQSCAGGNSGLPDTFCCKTGTECLPLAGKSTVICCPRDRSCDAIKPITCNIAEQNPDANLEAPIKTLALKSALPKCAKNNSCCPFGYTCSDDGQICKKDQDQSRPPDGFHPGAAPKSSGTASAASTAISTTTGSAAPSSTTTSSATTTDDAAPSGSNNASTIGAVVGSLLALVLVGLGIFLFVRSRRRGGPDSETRGGSSAVYANAISGPITNPNANQRVDFIRQAPSSSSGSWPRVDQLDTAAAKEFKTSFGAKGGDHRDSQSVLVSPASYDDGRDSRPVSVSPLTPGEDWYARSGHVDAERTPARSNTAHHISSLYLQHVEEHIDIWADPQTMNSPRDDARHGGARAHGSTRTHVAGTTPNV